MEQCGRSALTRTDSTPRPTTARASCLMRGITRVIMSPRSLAPIPSTNSDSTQNHYSNTWQDAWQLPSIPTAITRAASFLRSHQATRPLLLEGIRRRTRNSQAPSKRPGESSPRVVHPCGVWVKGMGPGRFTSPPAPRRPTSRPSPSPRRQTPAWPPRT